MFWLGLDSLIMYSLFMKAKKSDQRCWHELPNIPASAPKTYKYHLISSSSVTQRTAFPSSQRDAEQVLSTMQCRAGSVEPGMTNRRGDESFHLPFVYPILSGERGKLLLEEKVVLGQKLLKDLRLFGDVFDRLLAV